MGQTLNRADKLRHRLRTFIDGSVPTSAVIDEIQNEIAELLLFALENNEHPLALGLSDLQERVEWEKSGKLYKDTGIPEGRRSKESDPNRHLFMPHPGVSDPEKRRLWRLQLLLQMAARSQANALRLAERLRMTPEQMAAAANEAAKVSVAYWSPADYPRYLDDALAAADFLDPALPFRLEARQFIHNSGRNFRLPPMEAKFLQLLVEHVGQFVDRAQFKEAGIMHPTKVKERLLNCLEREGIELEIGAAPGSYILPLASR